MTTAATQTKAPAAGGASPLRFEALREAANALTPAIVAGRAQWRDEADLTSGIVAEMKDAGLLRAFQPRRWGGLELDPQQLFEIQNVFAGHCLSTAWVYGVLSVQSFMLGRMDPQAQADVWQADPTVLVSSSFAPAANVVPVDGGYRISGRFTFSSGSSHADWAMVGGIVPPDGDRPAPQMRLFLVPAADYRIDRCWDPFGLRATGSNDLVIEDAFVPAYRTMAPDSGIQPLPAASGLPPLYRLPWLYVFASTISNLAIGGGRAALDRFVAITRERQGAMGSGPSRDDPKFLSAIGRMRVELDTVQQQFDRNYGVLIDCVARDAQLASAEALLYRAELTGFLRRIVSLVDELMLLLGGRGIDRSGPLTAIWLDLMAARAHAGNDPSAVHVQLAQALIDRN